MVMGFFGRGKPGFNVPFQKRTRFGFWILLICVGAFLGMSCGGGGSGEVVNNNLGGGFSLGQVASLDMGSSNTATVTFEEVSGGEVFVFALSAGNSSGTYSFSLGGSSNLSLPSEDLETEFNFDLYDQVTQEGQSDFTPTFHLNLRSAENQMASVAKKDPQFSKAITTVVSNCSAPSIGSTQSIKIFNSLSGSSQATRTMTVRKVTDNVVFLVDQVIPSSVLSDTELDGFAETFNAEVENLTSVYGAWDHATECRFSVAISPVVGCIGASGGGWVTGYFYGVDQYDTSSLSNERSILYIASADPNGDLYCDGISVSKSFWESNIVTTVMKHEFQHLINFNQRVFFNGNDSESTWLNEALSHFAEDLAVSGASYDFDSVSVENPSRVNLFLSSIDSTSIAGGDSLTQRGGSYLFVRYLYEQADLGNLPGVSSGDELLGDLLTNEDTSVDNIASTTGRTMSDLISDYCATVYLDDTGLSSNSRYNFSGIDLRSDQEDNRGTSLSGPDTDSFSGSSGSYSVSSPTCHFVTVTGSQVASMGSVVGVSTSSSAEAAVKVIRAN